MVIDDLPRQAQADSQTAGPDSTFPLKSRESPPPIAAIPRARGSGSTHTGVDACADGYHNDDETSTLVRELQSQRQLTSSLEHDVAKLRDALAGKVAEIEALQRDATRLRQRAEAAELRPSAAVVTSQLNGAGKWHSDIDDRFVPLAEHQAIVADLQARLQLSDDRTVKGEILVGKLRAAFVAVQQGAAR